MIALVGCTGFVGSNIMKQGKIDVAYHSRNSRFTDITSMPVAL